MHGLSGRLMHWRLIFLVKSTTMDKSTTVHTLSSTGPGFELMTSILKQVHLSGNIQEYNIFVFNPRWDMHSLRAKEIKDSSNSQAVPKVLVLLKIGTVWFHNGSC